MEETAKTIIDLEETNESDFSLDHRRPERLLHFSDGTLGVDEYEDKPVDDPDKPQSQEGAATQGFKNRVWWIGERVINGIDYIGEGLASFLGITGPKFVKNPPTEAVDGLSKEHQWADDNDSVKEVNWLNSETAQVTTIAPQKSSKSIP